jgi:hypothetical protein
LPFRSTQPRHIGSLRYSRLNGRPVLGVEKAVLDCKGVGGNLIPRLTQHEAQFLVLHFSPP